jgi:hypothetical protein
LVNSLTEVLEDINERLVQLETRVGKIPDPLVLYYKPPGENDYQKINESLDDLFTRINTLETVMFE